MRNSENPSGFFYDEERKMFHKNNDVRKKIIVVRVRGEIKYVMIRALRSKNNMYVTFRSGYSCYLPNSKEVKKV